MSEYIAVPVQAAKDVAEKYAKQMVVILCYDREHGLTHTTTYGVMPFDKENAAAAGEICAKAVGADLGQKQVFEDFHNDYNPAKLKAAWELITSLRNSTPEFIAKKAQQIHEWAKVVME